MHRIVCWIRLRSLARRSAFSLALFSSLPMSGCNAPRARVSGPLVSVTVPDGATDWSVPPSVAGADRNITAARGRQSAGSTGTRTEPGSGPARDLQRSVARFVARPRDLFQPPTPVRRWEFIVLHHSATDTGGLASFDRQHREKNRWDECGYHFVIGNGTESGDGEIEVGTRWLKQKHGAHCKHADHPEYNDDGIGICLVGNCDTAPPTAKQIEACRRLVAYLIERCGVPTEQVTTHGDLAGHPTQCPGRFFPYDRIVRRPGFAAR